MVGIILIQDLFEGIPNDTDITGRVPPITDSGGAWQRETAFAGGDGAGNIKFSAGTACIRIRSLAEAVLAVRAVWNDAGVNNQCGLWIGDSAPTTIWPRYAYAAIFQPQLNVIELLRVDNYTATQIGPDYTTTAWNASGADNTFIFQRNGNDFQAMVNGVVIAGFTDSTYAPNGNRLRHSFTPFANVNQNGRLRSFEVLDSVAAAPVGAQPYTIVEVF